MDVLEKEYRRIVMEAANRLVARVDGSSGSSIAVWSSIARQLQGVLVQVEAHDLIESGDACSLILQYSDSPEAQSYRNTRMTNPGSELNVQRWAGLALATDVREKVFAILRISGLRIEEIHAGLLGWQHPQTLRGDFDDDAPWHILADWYEERGERVKAKLCREFALAYD